MASESEQSLVEAPAALSKYTKRVILETVLDRPDGGVGLIGQRVVIGGRVKSSNEFRKAPLAQTHDVGRPKDVRCAEVLQSRLPFLWSIVKVLGGVEHGIHDKLDSILHKPPHPSISILQVSDGSCVPSLQVLVDSTLAPPSDVMPTGTSILVEGLLQHPSLQGKQVIELRAEKILHVGTVSQDRYPLSMKLLPLEILRDSAHIRPRTTTIASAMRIRSSIAEATHTFFQDNGFMCVQVPVITSTDCEGLGEIFQVTTLFGKEKVRSTEDYSTEGVKLETIKASIDEKNKKIEELKRSDSNKEVLAIATLDLQKTTELVSQLEALEKAKSERNIQTNDVNFSEDFFSCHTYLTTSGRLHLESYANSVGNVYSCGPRFCSRKTDSKKMLAEMWMVELQMAFSQLEDSMECANDFLKFISKWVLENCTKDLNFVSNRVDKSVVDRLQSMATSPFEKISYTEAVEVLKKNTGKKFEAEVKWGDSLSEEHESYLTDEIYKKPLIIYNHPKELKPFYLRLNDDGKTVAAFDVIVPKIGTLIRGSQNEERFNMLCTRIKELGLQMSQYEWYLDLRRHGTANSSGFSFMFDPFVLYATGFNDVRDVVPFPRSFGKAND